MRWMTTDEGACGEGVWRSQIRTGPLEGWLRTKPSRASSSASEDGIGTEHSTIALPGGMSPQEPAIKATARTTRPMNCTMLIRHRQNTPPPANAQGTAFLYNQSGDIFIISVQYSTL